jgi:hypothetical protein
VVLVGVSLLVQAPLVVVAQGVCELVRGIKLPKELRTLLPLVVVVLGFQIIQVLQEVYQVGTLTQ